MQASACASEPGERTAIRMRTLASTSLVGGREGPAHILERCFDAHPVERGQSRPLHSAVHVPGPRAKHFRSEYNIHERRFREATSGQSPRVGRRVRALGFKVPTILRLWLDVGASTVSAMAGWTV